LVGFAASETQKCRSVLQSLGKGPGLADTGELSGKSLKIVVLTPSALNPSASRLRDGVQK
jgi:hypothetical protein